MCPREDIDHQRTVASGGHDDFELHRAVRLLSNFPFEPVLAELYDDLQPGGRYEQGLTVRADGRGPTTSRGKCATV